MFTSVSCVQCSSALMSPAECGVAVASTNGERGMRPRGREVEKRVGSAQCAVRCIKRIRVLYSGAKDTKNGITQEKWTENSSGKADWSANREISYLAVGLQANVGQSS